MKLQRLLRQAAWSEELSWSSLANIHLFIIHSYIHSFILSLFVFWLVRKCLPPYKKGALQFSVWFSCPFFHLPYAYETTNKKKDLLFALENHHRLERGKIMVIFFPVHSGGRCSLFTSFFSQSVVAGYATHFCQCLAFGRCRPSCSFVY